MERTLRAYRAVGLFVPDERPVRPLVGENPIALRPPYCVDVRVQWPNESGQFEWSLPIPSQITTR